MKIVIIVLKFNKTISKKDSYCDLWLIGQFGLFFNPKMNKNP